MEKLYEFNKKNINDFYNRNMKYKRYGYKRHNFVAWTSLYNQEIRYEKLLEIGVKNGDIILDFGCGLGDLYGYTKKINLNINYIGVDINENFINDALNHYGEYIGDSVKFHTIDGVEDIEEQYDWFLASGSFTYKMDIGDIFYIVEKGYKKSKKGVAFNLLRNDKASKYLVYNSGVSEYNPDYIKKLFEKYLKTKVELIEGYLSNDFTLYVKK